MPAAVNGMKECGRCRETKDVSEYSKGKGKDGLASPCKSCERQYRQENKKRIKERDRRYYQDNKEYILKQMKQYALDNREKISENNKQYHIDNAEKLCDKSRVWYRNQLAGVYEIENKITGRIYIGESKGTRQRMQTHRRRLRKKIHENSSLQADYNKYGLDAFDFRVFQEYRSDITKKILFDAEQSEIKKRLEEGKSLYNNRIPILNDGRVIVDFSVTKEEWESIIDKCMELDMSLTEYVSHVIATHPDTKQSRD